MPPDFSHAKPAGGRPRVLYLAPDLAAPSGGTRTIYRHVDLLNAAGIDAAVVHRRPGFRCEWFPNSTPVLAAGKVAPDPLDVLVVPEWNAVGFHRLPAAPRKIIFNQGPYHTFDHVPFDGTAPGHPYRAVENLVAMLTVSLDGATLLRYAFPDIPVSQVRAVVDSRLFLPPDLPAGRRIAFMPRRRQQEREQLLHILRSRGALEGWELVPIDGCTENRTAELLRSSAIFLSFSEREGFGLPPAEAMACGCYVVGFTGLGGRDYFDPAFCSPVPESDLYAFANAVEDAIRRYDAAPDHLAGAGRAAALRIHDTYHEAGLSEDLVGIYRPLVTGATAQLTPGRPDGVAP
jgi:glycosyltransferase involved in cell wall biosynthesis